MIKVIALDLEGTLISNAMSQIVRPDLYSFLEECKDLWDRLVIYTTIKEGLFREIARLLISEEKAPGWFESIEYINWEGKIKDLTFIPNCNIEEAILVDDFYMYIHPDQKSQWVEIKQFEHPYLNTDTELMKTLNVLKQKI